MELDGSTRALRELLDWRPPGGIVSIYVDVDPSDRGGGWRIALRDGLRRVVEAAPERGVRRRTVEALADAVVRRFDEDAPRGMPRGQIGFFEVADKGRESWRQTRIPPRRTEVVHSSRPYLRPLVEILATGPVTGVAVVSAERVRLLEWSLEGIRELEDWEIVLWSRDWRERKAERTRDPARGQGTSASGHDQYGQRLEANRDRFLHEAGGRIRAIAAERGWRHALAFGEEQHARPVAEGLGHDALALHEFHHNLISAGDGEIGERAEAAMREVHDKREAALVRQVNEAIGAGPGVALGPQEAWQALAQGRVRQLIFDADRDYEGRPLEDELAANDQGLEGDLPLAERLIELAVASDAEITPLVGESAAALDAHDGVVALLRY
jgi:hypothetical protein